MPQLVYQSIKTKSGNVGYAKIGSGCPLILIVGYSGTLFHWNQSLVMQLAKHFSLYLMDNRKIGLSDSNNEESLAGFAQDVIDFIDALNLKSPRILGWSMGGVIAQEIAKNYPHKISGMILQATVPSMSVVNTDFTYLTINSHQYTAEEFKAKLYYFFFSQAQHTTTKDEIKANSVQLANYHYRFNQQAKKLQDKVISCWSGMTAVALSKIDVPTLLLWAKDDLVVPKQAVEFLFANIPQAKLIIYSNGGHFLIHANARQMAQDIISFFA